MTSTTTGVAIVVAASSILSLCGSGFIVGSYVLWPRIRTKSRLLLVCLSCADYAAAAGYGASAFAILFLGEDFPKEQRFSCEFQSIVTTWSSVATFCWTVALATHLYVAIVRNAIDSAKKLFPVFAVLCLGIPTAVVICAAFSHALGYAFAHTTSGWCWISEQPIFPVFDTGSTRYAHARLFWMLMAGKFWEISSCIVIFVLYFLIRQHVRHQTKYKCDQFITAGSKVAAEKADSKMIVIPVAFLFLRVWGTTRFLIDVIKVPEGHNQLPGYKPLMYLQGIGDTAQGFVNFIIFCWNTDTVRHLMLACLCCRESKPHASRDASESASLLDNKAASRRHDGTAPQQQAHTDHRAPFDYSLKDKPIDARRVDNDRTIETQVADLEDSLSLPRQLGTNNVVNQT